MEMESHMVERNEIANDVFVGAQPTEEDLRELAEHDFRTIVNVRTYDENEQPLSPRAEGVLVHELGMDYLSFPVAYEDLNAHKVDDFRTKLDLMAKPVFVHCKSGKRSGALALMVRAAREGWSGAETVQQAEQMGFECNAPALKQFVKSYVDEKNA